MATSMKTQSSSVRPTGGAKAANTPAAPAAKPGRLFMGMMILMIAAQVLNYGLFFLDNRMHQTLSKTHLFAIPGVNWQISPLILISIAILFGLYWALIRFGILPRASAVAAQRVAAQQQRTGTSSSLKGNKSATSTAGKPAAGEIAHTSRVKGTTINGENDDLYLQVRAQQRAQARKKRK